MHSKELEAYHSEQTEQDDETDEDDEDEEEEEEEPPIPPKAVAPDSMFIFKASNP